MKRMIRTAVLLFLVFAFVGCAKPQTFRIGDDMLRNHNDQLVYALIELSCHRCELDEAIQVTIRYAVDFEVFPSDSLRIVVEHPWFSSTGSAEYVIEDLNDTHAMSRENNRYILRNSLMFTLSADVSGFFFGCFQVSFYDPANPTEPLRELSIGYVFDELGIVVERSVETAMRISLNRLYDKKLIDRAEYVRRECLWLFEHSVGIQAVSRNVLELSIEYQSSAIRIHRIIERNHPAAQKYLEVEALYDEIWEREKMFRPEWLREERQDVARMFVEYLFENGVIGESLRDDEVARMVTKDVSFASVGSPMLSYQRFGMAAFQLFYRIDDSQSK
jgi:hypothetical protein